MKINAILFDAAETLFTTRGAVGEIYAAIARDYGSQASPEDVQAAFQRRFRHAGPVSRESEKAWWKRIVGQVFSDVGMVRDFDAFFDALYERFRDSSGWVLFPETRPTLEGLKRLDLNLGVVSNFDSRIYSVMRSLDILSFFDSVTISSETGYAKPHPEIFRAAARALKQDPADILMVGDNLDDDALAAVEAGMRAALIDRSDGSATAPAVPKIQNLQEIFGILAISA